MTDINLGLILDDSRADIGALAIEPLPSGEDLRGEPEFETLETEFRKIETGGPTAVDWKLLNRKTLEILQGRSKDLVLASRLVYGLYREEGYRGMAVGISILRGMVAEHWEGMFPPLSRERGRAGTLDWLAEKLATTVESEPPAEDKKLFALIAHDRLVELDTLLSEKLKKYPVAMGPLVRALRPHSREARQAIEAQAAREAELERAATEPSAVAAPVEPPRPETPAETPPPAAVVPVSTPSPVPSASAVAMPAVPEIAVGEGAEKALQTLFSTAARIATAVRQEAPADARVYLCARFAIWGQIDRLPPERAGKTLLPPPQASRLAEIKALHAAGNYQDLLMSAESAFFSSPFWLDAQYMIAQSMQALGAPYDQARIAVAGELALFLKRVPGLAQLSFSDGTPFASAETISWIAAEVEAGDGANAPGADIDIAKAEATKLAQQGQILPGLKLLADFAEGRHGERDRFLARLEVGEYCLRFDLLQPLLALVGKLETIAEKNGLAHWEPQVAAALANLSWRALDHKNAKRFMDEGQLLESKSAVVSTLAGLDIVMAARFSLP
ncbi:type VI secretion system protein VasJ [Rhizobium sp. BK313]|uniref:type VI secretion system protein TssA n=1 Tax=Rhizobium sp. BK313 TaxID=2587081 RepID=UPI001061AA27|nr:type VI secretion system protein TssA [Rhizobium sp. BK313]MBB3457484.1 type VI secretion system protein VasJ [Rhizobium sp. BK313]